MQTDEQRQTGRDDAAWFGDRHESGGGRQLPTPPHQLRAEADGLDRDAARLEASADRGVTPDLYRRFAAIRRRDAAWLRQLADAREGVAPCVTA